MASQSDRSRSTKDGAARSTASLAARQRGLSSNGHRRADAKSNREDCSVDGCADVWLQIVGHAAVGANVCDSRCPLAEQPNPDDRGQHFWPLMNCTVGAPHEHQALAGAPRETV
jgi:hypothetical protein